jgi:hypothetical protein
VIPLPEPKYPAVRLGLAPGELAYTADQMRAYASACVAEAVAAKDAEIEALRKDAERYRWLRKTTNWVTSKGERVDVRNNPELWDSSIDAAIRAGSAGGES